MLALAVSDFASRTCTSSIFLALPGMMPPAVCSGLITYFPAAHLTSS